MSGESELRPRPVRRLRLTRGPGLVALVAVIAVASLVAGVVLSRFVISPAQAAADARPPAAGPITAPIEQRVIQNTVATRADVTYADAVDVKVDSTGLAGPAVVTGHVPEVGATLDAGSVALEVAGRPLLVLPGDLPVYRTLHAGLSGPDVTQLKSALASLGHDPGDPASDVFDAATASALDELYRAAGYPAPAASPDARQQLSAARSAVRGAEGGVSQARAALEAASTGATAADRVAQENAVRQAQRELDAATATGAPQSEIDRLHDELVLAETRRDQLAAGPDVSAQRAAVDAALGQLSDAQDALADAERAALTVLPASEVVYLSSLPRRVDSVTATRGSVTSGAAMSVSGAVLQLAGSASEADAALLKSGMAATFTAVNGSEYTATVDSVTPHKASGDTATPGGGTAGASPGNTGKRYDLRLTPQSLDDGTVEALRGSNVRVLIPVQSTSGEVLAVPVAAVTAGPGGESRIELAVEPGAAAATAETTALVTVTTGLSADGFVEVTSVDPRVRVGAQVVVGT